MTTKAKRSVSKSEKECTPSATKDCDCPMIPTVTLAIANTRFTKAATSVTHFFARERESLVSDFEGDDVVAVITDRVDYLMTIYTTPRWYVA